MGVAIEIENLPKKLQKKGLKEKLVEICERHNIVFMAVFGSFVRGSRKQRAI
ncbi:MAG: hypothetical protein ABWK01_07285 [Infirmifilum sp.]